MYGNFCAFMCSGVDYLNSIKKFVTNEVWYRVVNFNFQKFLYESIEDHIKSKCIKY